MKEKKCFMCQKPILTLMYEEFYLLSALNFNNRKRKKLELNNDIYLCKKCFEKTKMYKEMIRSKEIPNILQN